LERELFQNFLGVLGGVLHRSHTGGLLRGRVVKEGNPQVGGDVQLVHGEVGGVLIGQGCVVQAAESHGSEETASGHKLHLANNSTNGGHELVVKNDDFVVLLSSLRNVLSDGHAGGVVKGLSDILDCGLHQVGHVAVEAGDTLVTNSENLHSGAVRLVDEVSNSSNDAGVNAATKTLVGGEGHQERLGVVRGLGGAALHVHVSLEDHIHSLVSEVLTTLETHQVTLHLGGGDELHGLGDFTDVVDGLHSGLEGLLGDGKVAGGVGHQHRQVISSVHLHGGNAVALQLEFPRGGCRGRRSTTASGHRTPSGAARGAGRPGATSKVTVLLSEIKESRCCSTGCTKSCQKNWGEKRGNKYSA